jgi:hypothetical protein
MHDLEFLVSRTRDSEIPFELQIRKSSMEWGVSGIPGGSWARPRWARGSARGSPIGGHPTPLIDVCEEDRGRRGGGIRRQAKNFQKSEANVTQKTGLQII